jgi:hypothetical protein
MESKFMFRKCYLSLAGKNYKEKIGSLIVFVNTTFRGRKYYAWYAPEIAVYSGLGN